MPSLTQSPKHRQIIVISGLSILAICGAWIVYVLRPTSNIKLVNNPILSPEVLEAATLTAELKKDEQFKHLELSRIDDQTWMCAGEVAKSADVQAAKTRAQELKSGVEWKFEIVPMH